MMLTGCATQSVSASDSPELDKEFHPAPGHYWPSDMQRAKACSKQRMHSVEQAWEIGSPEFSR